MRKSQKKQALDYIKLLEEVHGEVKKYLEKGEKEITLDLLAQCQDGAIQLGEFIDHLEGEGTRQVWLLEKYCEVLFQEYEKIEADIKVQAYKVYKQLEKQRIQIENSINNDLKERKEIVFLPYKASMWDSLESIYLAAVEDKDCEVYVIPIPYYDKNKDGTLGKLHYEGTEFADNIPIVWYENYDFSEREPDVIYIHNPYDEYNYVTTVDPRFYSYELKKYTDCLVYVPYYATSGGMNSSQALCSAYIHADYIVIQAEKYRKFFDKSVPQEKLIALGSPKFDKIIRMCNHPKQIPDVWKEEMKGRNVYFYNTSLNGMLADTENFLKKMRYVFECFRNRKDVCLLWRPHPLFESTLNSLRKEYLGEFIKLRKDFIDNKIGIYDETPDMNETIALCDAYIGDEGSSVTSIFGIVGKPIFILNNRIHEKPEAEDWKGNNVTSFYPYQEDKWLVTPGNKLYYSPNADYHYEYYCTLSEYGGGIYYKQVYEYEGRQYVCPINAQDILVLENREIKKRIPLKKNLAGPGAFSNSIQIGHKLYLMPFFYPDIVVYDMEEETVKYLSGYKDTITQMVDGEWRRGGNCVWKHFILIASPVNQQILAIDTHTDMVHLLEIKTKKAKGSLVLQSDGEEVWYLPYRETTIICWNPQTGQTKEYTDIPTDFICKKMSSSHECMYRPFSSLAFADEYVYLSPCWGNQYLRIQKNTGDIEKWCPPYPVLEEVKNGYYNYWSRGAFIQRPDDINKYKCYYYSSYDAKFYEIDLRQQVYKEIPVVFKQEDILKNEPGFCETSEWIQYSCEENAINTLEDFLNQTLKGKPHSKEKQIEAYGKIAANNDGSCGEKIHEFISRRK